MNLPNLVLMFITVASIGAALASSSVSAEGEFLSSGGKRVSGKIAFASGQLKVTEQDGQVSSHPLGSLASLTLKPDLEEPDQPEPVADGRLPAPWKFRDIGGLVAPGRSSWDGEQFSISMTTRSEAADFDSFHMIYLETGDQCEIVARVVNIDGEDGEAGVVLCSSPDLDSQKARLLVKAEGGAYLRTWARKGGSTRNDKNPEIRPPYWVKLNRDGKQISAWTSPNGRSWTLLRETRWGSDGQSYLGLAGKVYRKGEPANMVIDQVSLNGEPVVPAPPVPPRLVLYTGTVLASEVESATTRNFKLSGRWESKAILTPWVARVEFVHPLVDDSADAATAGRQGIALRDGDFAEGEFVSLEDGRLKLNTTLFGPMDRSVLDDVDALILRKVSPPSTPVIFRVATHGGSEFLASEMALVENGVHLDVRALGRIELKAEEIRSIERLGQGSSDPDQ